jgi:hypothetical protein
MLKKYGRKFTFAIAVFIFAILSIILNTFLLYKGKIGEHVYKDLYIMAGGFVTLLATSYFFANAKAKRYENGNEDKEENRNGHLGEKKVEISG